MNQEETKWGAFGAVQWLILSWALTIGLSVVWGALCYYLFMVLTGQW